MLVISICNIISTYLYKEICLRQVPEILFIQRKLKTADQDTIKTFVNIQFFLGFLLFKVKNFKTLKTVLAGSGSAT